MIKGTYSKDNTKQKNLFRDFPFFYEKFYLTIQEAINEFFEKPFETRFTGITTKENILFFGDEYFVNKIPLSINNDFTIRISSTLIEYFLSCAIGPDNKDFDLKNLTDIEAMLIKSLTIFIYEKLKKLLPEDDKSVKQNKGEEEYSLTIFIKNQEEHMGKMIISLPAYMQFLQEQQEEQEQQEQQENFTIDDFRKAKTKMNVIIGKTRLELNEIKALEDGDLVLLENSDINKMSIKMKEKTISFRINPNPSLIIKVDNNGGNTMDDTNKSPSENMWDSILVDVVAEFDNVKLTLGELKQISEGLVIDVGSVYENKVNLKVENQVIAKGELVIINDRYGVRIDSITKTADRQPKERYVPNDEEEEIIQPRPSRQRHVETQDVNEIEDEEEYEDNENSEENQEEEDKDFDYSDFEIEDESI